MKLSHYIVVTGGPEAAYVSSHNSTVDVEISFYCLSATWSKLTIACMYTNRFIVSLRLAHVSDDWIQMTQS